MTKGSPMTHTQPSEVYRGFKIERCEYATPRFPDMAYQWSPDEEDGETPYRYAASVYEARDDIDEHLDEQDVLAELAHYNRNAQL